MRCALDNRDDHLPGFETKTPPIADAVRCAIAEAMAWLTDCKVADSDRGNVEIVLAEALNNVVEHGQMLPNEDITIILALSSHHVQCTIRDTGVRSSVLVERRNGAASCPGDIDALPEGGFGISLIQAIASEIEYLPVAQGNLVALTVPLTTNPVQI